MVTQNGLTLSSWKRISCSKYKTFVDYGKGGYPPKGSLKIRLHWVFDVKHDGRHKARCVAGGYLTPPLVESIYSEVVSMLELRLMIFLGKLNDLKLFGADIKNAYLEAKTKEKVYFIADKGLGELEGHTMGTYIALYRHKTLGKHWYKRMADVCKNMGLKMSKIGREIWMQDCGDHYKYIAVYVDNLAITSKDPPELINTLRSDYNFKIKGVGLIDFHLEMQFSKDPDGTLVQGTKRYIEKMLKNFRKNHGYLPKEKATPLLKNDHPQDNDTKELGPKHLGLYQLMIGEFQWLVTLGRFDIHAAATILSCFLSTGRVGHLKSAQRMYCYLWKHKNGAIRFCTGLPDYKDLKPQVLD